MIFETDNVEFRRIESVLALYFRSSFLCECDIPQLRSDLSKILSFNEVETVMVWCCFSSLMQSAVHCYAGHLWLRYEEASKFDFQVFGHGGPHRVYACFLEGLDRAHVKDIGSRFLNNWWPRFDCFFKCSGGKIVIQRLTVDPTFHQIFNEDEIRFLTLYL